ncbi:hypothetical protein [Actinomadura sp. SCN-SB]|uniref:hypothetical protein n=1 Tax=Actinomadura sp. SCN-SB TaxID=3373092 RepID=UPI00374FFA4D
MLRSQRERRVRTRTTYTGEPISTAGRHLARMGEDEPPIPAAAEEQAALETRLLAKWGYTEYRAWDVPFDRSADRRRKAYPPFGFRYVVPLTNELQISVHPDLLPQFIDRVLPSVDPDSGEVWGIPGLRARVHNRYVLLARPGMDARIKIWVRRTHWDNAVARALQGLELDMVAWLTRPDEWTLEETLFIERYGHLYDYRVVGNAFISGLLRRCHALHGQVYTRYWHLWMDSVVKLEWAGGLTHRVVIDRLQDPDFGLQAALEDETWQCRCEETEGDRRNPCYWATLIDHSGLELDLRRHPIGIWEETTDSRWHDGGEG